LFLQFVDNRNDEATVGLSPILMDRRIRVLLIAPSLEIVGGQSVQAAHLMAAFRTVPALEVIFQPINPRVPVLTAALENVKFVRTAVNWVVFVSMLLARVWRCDVVHTFSAGHSSYVLWPLTALTVSRLFGKPIVLNYRDGRAGDHLRTSRIAAPTMRRFNAVVAPSGYLVDVFAQFGVPARSIFNIAPLEKLKFRDRRHLRPEFLHNRGLESLYNVPCSLRAFQIVQSRYPEAALTVAHDGPLRAELEEYVRTLGLKNVRFTGSVTHARMAELYDAADVYLTSPDVDNMPGSLLECFASGLPVIATRVGGIPYIARDEEDALLVPPDDHEGMARAVFRFMDDPALVEKLTRNARERCAQYSADAVSAEWLALYRKLAHA
jgi:L-malate glycosyltransferase